MTSRNHSASILRVLVLIVGVLLAGLVAPQAAYGHGEGESDQSLVLVRQAIALMVNKPGDQMAIQDKLNDCLQAPKKEGVNLAMVRQAMAMMKPGDSMNTGTMMTSGDMMQVRQLLEKSIGARPFAGAEDPVQIGAVPPPLTGADTGTLVALDPMPGRHGLTAAAWVALVVAGLVVSAGMALSFRLRPKLAHPQMPEGAQP